MLNWQPHRGLVGRKRLAHGMVCARPDVTPSDTFKVIAL